MSADTVIELETHMKTDHASSPLTSKRYNQQSTKFKSTAFVAVATARKPKRTVSWTKKLSSSKLLSLDYCKYQKTIPIHTLATEGKLEELKSAITENNLTLKETDNHGYTLLHHAALHNQEQVMLFLIDNGIDIDAVDNEGNTALHLAAEKDFPEACHVLLENGATDTILNKETLAPLHLAAAGKNKALKAILDHLVDFAVQGLHNRTPLHTVCQHDNIEGMTILNEMVLDKAFKDKNNISKVCTADSNGLTPFHLAARKNSFQCLDLIIQKCKELGFSTEQALGFIDEENSTPLHAAVDSCNFEVVEVLLKHGASPIETQGDLIPPFHMACSQGRSDMIRTMVEYAGPEIIAHTDQLQKTPLHYCALSIHSSCMIPFLMEKGKGLIVVDAQDAKGRTPLHNAITSANLAGTKELLSYGANPLKTDKKGMNALHLAVGSNRKVIVNALLELPYADELVNHTCNKGYTAIHHALHVGHGEFIPKMIAALQFGIQRMQDEEGNNYLHLAAGKGNIKALKALLNVAEIHKMLNEPNTQGLTALHAAAAGGHYRCTDLLLNNGAMFHKAFNGETAFLVACKKGFTDCAKLLLKAHPCQINMTDNEGNTPLHAAAISKTPSMITLLLGSNCALALNSDELTFFDIIVNLADFDCAMAVVNHNYWQECLDFGSPSHPCPMIHLIEQMPKVAKAVLDRCHVKVNNLDKSHPEYWESYDFKYLYSESAKQSPEGTVHTNTADVHPELDDSVTTIKYKDRSQTQPDESKRQKRNREVSSGKETMKVLEKMKLFKRQSLLTHPVVNAYLESKWRKYGNLHYYGVYLFQIFVVVIVSTFVVFVPNPTQLLQPPSNLTAPIPSPIGSGGNNSFPELPPLTTEAEVLRSIALFLNLIHSLWILYNIAIYLKRKGGFGMFLYVSGWFHFLSVLFNFIFFLFPNPLEAWPIGALTCFFSWFSLFLSLENSSIPGTIVKMFLEVTKTVFLVLVVSIFLLLAFAFSFYILTGNLSEFSHVGYAFLSVFSFMLGELPYDEYIQEDVSRNLFYSDLVLTFILFMAILMSIVLANLLIGLAVGDIERIKSNAILQRKAIEVEFFSQIDASLPRRYIKQCSLPSYKSYLNKNQSIYTLWRNSWKWIEAQIEPEEADTSTSAIINSMTIKINELNNNILELKETIQQMQEANAEFQRRYTSLSGRSSLSSLYFNQGEEQTEVHSLEN